MSSSKNQSTPDEQFIQMYRNFVTSKHPEKAVFWPIISGYNSKAANVSNWLVLIFIHTGNAGMTQYSGLGELPMELLGVSELNEGTIEIARKNIAAHFGCKSRDSVVLIPPDGQADNELQIMLKNHELAMGLSPMKIFLSHKGIDKPIVREFKETLQILGFDPWLDEDAMSAGMELERGLLKGFQNSCAAVFFITPNFKDENFLATEINYAMTEKRNKGDRFSIITLIFEDANGNLNVPELLRQYVWKKPNSNLEAMREILKALPLELGRISLKQ